MILTIQPGVEVKFSATYYLWVYADASIIADGTYNDSIRFTRWDTGYWSCIYLGGSSSGEFKYCKFSYGGYDRGITPQPGMLLIESGNCSVTDSCDFYNGMSEAIRANSGDAELRIKDNYVHDNESGIYVLYGHDAITTGNHVYNHTGEGSFGIKVHSDAGTIANNLINNNTNGILGDGYDNGVVRNNLIVGMGTSGSVSYGIHHSLINEADITVNNIVTNCYIGIYGTGSGFAIQYECMFGNGTNYDNAVIDPYTSTTQSALFVGGGDYHLTHGSPCVNKGYNGPNGDWLEPSDNSPNDMGIYGGNYDWPDYYVLVPADMDTVTHLLHATYKVMPNLAVPNDNGTLLTLDAGSVLKFGVDNIGITINSGATDGAIEASGLADKRITLTTYATNIRWRGITLTSETNTLSTLKYLNIDNCYNGILCDNATLASTHPIQNCNFTNVQGYTDSKGIYLDACDTRVHSCTFDNCHIGIAMYCSNSEVDSNYINVDTIGIYVRNGSTYTLEYDTLRNHSIQNTGIVMINAGGGELIHNRIGQVYNGMYIENSDPRMKDNFIDTCAFIGMHLISGSEPVMHFTGFYANDRIADCDSNEVFITGTLYPQIYGGHNDLINNRDDQLHKYIIYSTLNPLITPYTYDVGGNYWVWDSEAEIRAVIYPHDFSPTYVISVSSFGENSYTGYIASFSEDMLAEGVALEMDSLYADAYAVYQEIISSYPDDQVATSAIRRMFACVEGMGGNYVALYNDYTQLATAIENSQNLLMIFRMEGNALRAAGSFEPALSLFENLLPTVTNTTDSVFVLMDIENTLFDMGQSGIGTNGLGFGYNGSPSENFAHYCLRMAQLRQILDPQPFNSSNQVVAIPANIQLGEAYPNPFNPTSIISFSLPTATKVNLTVYDVTGKMVKTLVNGWREAGNHQIAFNATNYASGIYFYRLQTNNFTVCRKMLLLK